MRSSVPPRPRVLRATPVGRHRFTDGTQLGGVFTPVPGLSPGPATAVLDRPPVAPGPVTTGPVTTGPVADPESTAWGLRALRTIAGILLVTWAFRLSGYLTSGPWLAVAVVVLGLTGLLTILAAWLPESVLGRRRARAMDWAALIAVLVALALWSYFQVFTAPDYGTDEIAFDQYAAQLALHGVNPYLHSMAAAFPLFHVSPNGYTFLLSGKPVTSLSYPALSFEAYLPLLALGVTTQAAVWTDVAAWGIGCAVLFAVLPRRLAPLAVVVASLDVYIGYAVGGVTDFLFVPLLAGAAAGWDQFSRRRGPAAWRGPALLGLACAVKQTPWLIVPFVVLGVVLEARRDQGLARAARHGLRYLAILAIAFLIPNAPYIVAGPEAWLKGILTPLTASTVPAGQGLISLSLSLAAGGGSLEAYSLATVVVMAALLACFAAAYPAMKATAFLLPSLALFFATRSFGSYLVMLIPSAIVGAATVTRMPAARCWRRWRWVAAGSLLATVATAATALATPSPLSITVTSLRTTGQLATVERLRLGVTNNSGSPMSPTFTIQEGTSTTAFWRRISGPARLGPHRHATYIIEAPSYFAMPSIDSGFQVLAFGQHPGSVSRSGAYVASLWRVVLQPATISKPVRTGHKIRVRAQIVNRLDQPMRVANVPVYLGQAIYAQRGLQYGQAQINHAKEGRTPVKALTNARGVATFTVRGWEDNPNPVYFEANLVKPQSAYPYGYSPILSIKFKG